MTQDLDKMLSISPLVLDGALGTELERHGVDTSGKSWTAHSLVTNPDLIYDLHREYISNGADILTANTFRTNIRAIRGTRLDAEALTKTAVSIAQKARQVADSSQLIAGSIAPVEDCFSPELVPASNTQLLEEHRVMARWLNEAGIDIILIETMNSLREAVSALRAAKEESSKYIWVSVVPKDEKTMLDGTPLDDAVREIKEGGAHLVALNCAPVSVIMAALPLFSKAAKEAGIRFGCYPNASEKRSDGSWDLRASTDDRIAKCTLEWLKQGAVMVGSCCHSTPRTTSTILHQKENFLLSEHTPRKSHASD